MKIHSFVYYIFWILILNGTFQNESYAQGSDFDKILWAVDWSPDGKFIAAGGNSGSLKIYANKRFKLLKTYPIKGTITVVKWHPFEPLLAITTQSSENKMVKSGLKLKL